MTTFPLPALTLPDSLHTVADLRDALEQANRQLVEQAVRIGATSGALANLAEQLDRLLRLYRAGANVELVVELETLARHHGAGLPPAQRELH